MSQNLLFETEKQTIKRENKIQILELQENQNRKLNCDVFSMILPATKNKNLGQKFCIRLRGQVFCKATLIKKQTLSLSEVLEKECYLLDSGLEKQDFIIYIENHYSKKKFWKQLETKFDYLIFKKEVQLNLFENKE